PRRPAPGSAGKGNGGAGAAGAGPGRGPNGLGAATGAPGAGPLVDACGTISACRSAGWGGCAPGAGIQCRSGMGVCDLAWVSGVSYWIWPLYAVIILSGWNMIGG